MPQRRRGRGASAEEGGRDRTSLQLALALVLIAGVAAWIFSTVDRDLAGSFESLGGVVVDVFDLRDRPHRAALLVLSIVLLIVAGIRFDRWWRRRVDAFLDSDDPPGRDV